MVTAAEASIQALRRDIALQVSKCLQRSGDTQVAVALRVVRRTWQMPELLSTARKAP